jgi:hypothetical protein
MPIRNVVPEQERFERIAIEMRLPGRLRDGPDIRDLADFVRPKKSQELLRRMDRVTNRVHPGGVIGRRFQRNTGHLRGGPPS